MVIQYQTIFHYQVLSMEQFSVLIFLFHYHLVDLLQLLDVSLFSVHWMLMLMMDECLCLARADS